MKYYPMDNESTTFTKEDEESLFRWLSGKPTTPNKAVWKKSGFFKRLFLGYEWRIRLQITEENISQEMRDIYVKLKYNRESEPQGIQKIVSIIKESCVEAGILLSIENDEDTLETGVWSFYHPYKFDIGMSKVHFELNIPIGEVQLYIIGYNKESSENKIHLDKFIEISGEKIQSWVLKGYTI